MKKIIAILLIVIMCVCVVGCKDDQQQQTAKKSASNVQKATTALENTKCSEQAILLLLESNLDCHAVFYVTPLTSTTQQNSDGYLGVDKNMMADYNTLSELVRNTYCKERAEELLNYPSKETPLYKNVGGDLFVKPDVVKFEQYNIFWENPSVKIIKEDANKCEFEITTEKDSQPYTVKSSAVYEDGKWLLTDIIC